MTRTPRDALCGRLDTHDRLVEVGIGRRPGLARALAATGASVTATDRVPREIPSDVTFVRDDITSPELGIYADADALYARNLPPELHRPVLAVARACDAALQFTTLGGDPPAIPTTPETLSGVTLYHAQTEGPGATAPTRPGRGHDREPEHDRRSDQPSGRSVHAVPGSSVARRPGE